MDPFTIITIGGIILVGGIGLIFGTNDIDDLSYSDSIIARGKNKKKKLD